MVLFFVRPGKKRLIPLLDRKVRNTFVSEMVEGCS